MALRTLREDYERHRAETGAFIALTLYRFGRWAMERPSRASRIVFSKIYGLLNTYVTTILKIHLPPQIEIGEDFHIVHASGFLAVHSAVVIGDRCGIMHNVTIGQNMTGGAPRIGDDVFIGTGAVVLGEIEIGDRVRIGANAVVTTTVPADSIVLSPQSRILPSLAMMGQKPAGTKEASDKTGKTS